MTLHKKYFTYKILLAFLCPFISTNLLAIQPNSPLAIHYNLNKVEDNLEKSFDKMFKINWDFDIVYHEQKVFVILEYDQHDAKKLKKLSHEDLSSFIKTIIKQITKSLKTDIEVNGIIIEDDAQTPTYTFKYKDGKFDFN